MYYFIPTIKTKYLSLPILGLGTYQMGGAQQRDFNNNDKQDIETIRYSLECGISHIDTAETYAQGHTEILVSQAIEKFPRDKIFITSKVYPNHLHYENVIQAARGSLQRLKTPYLDMYLIHGPNKNIPIHETMAAMDYLIDRGLTRYIGVSNFDAQLIEEAQKYSKNKIVTNQIHYSLVARAFERNGTIDYCRKNNILITAYRPFGKYGEITKESNPILQKLSTKYNKTYAQIVLRWVMQKKNVVALFKTSNKNHLLENLGSLDFELDKIDMAFLDSDFPQGETLHVP